MLVTMHKDQLSTLAESLPFNTWELQLEQRHRKSSLFLTDHPDEHWIDILLKDFEEGNAEYILERIRDVDPSGLFIIENILEEFWEESRDSYFDSFYPNGDRFDQTLAHFNVLIRDDHVGDEVLEFVTKFETIESMPLSASCQNQALIKMFGEPETLFQEQLLELARIIADEAMGMDKENILNTSGDYHLFSREY
jgi:hypothetical protein